jgi:hypothetical protein
MSIQNRQVRNLRSSSGSYRSSQLAAHRAALVEDALVEGNLVRCLEDPLLHGFLYLAFSSASCIQANIRAAVHVPVVWTNADTDKDPSALGYSHMSSAFIVPSAEGRFFR